MIFKDNASILNFSYHKLCCFFGPLKIALFKMPISSDLHHTSKIYLLLDFIMEGEILAIVSDGRLIAVISNFGASLKLWVEMANLFFPYPHIIVDWQKQSKF